MNQYFQVNRNIYFIESFKFNKLLIYLLIFSQIEREFKKEWFHHIPKYPKEFWNNLNNSQKFLDQISNEHNINTSNDWKRITISLIKKNGGQVKFILIKINKLRDY